MSSFTLILCSVWALFFEKNLHKAILSHFPCQSFTKSKSQDTLILGLSAGSGNCWHFIDFILLLASTALILFGKGEFKRKCFEFFL